MRYLTGYSGSNGVVCLTAGSARLVTDFRYAEATRELADVLDVEIAERDLLGDIAGATAPRFPGASQIGFETAQLPFGRVEQLRAGGGAWSPTSGLVEALRVVKSDAEIAAIRVACEPVTEAYRTLAEEGLVGRTERDVAFRIAAVFHAAGYERSFDPIVGSGANGALPHGRPGDRVIERGDLVVLDIGARREDGYCSDCTRTMAAGAEPSAEALEDYALVRRAQEEALAAVHAGALASAVDGASRVAYDERGLGGLYGHGLGHGIGLDVHESPYFRRESAGTVPAGAVMSVEPGIYRSGRWGIRIEDLVVIREGGCEILTPFPKDLVVSGG